MATESNTKLEETDCNGGPRGGSRPIDEVTATTNELVVVFGKTKAGANGTDPKELTILIYQMDPIGPPPKKKKNPGKSKCPKKEPVAIIEREKSFRKRIEIEAAEGDYVTVIVEYLDGSQQAVTRRVE